jgi:hypothetical protein
MDLEDVVIGIGLVIIVFIFLIIFFLVFGFVFMILWNFGLTALFGLQPIDFWTGFWLTIIFKIIFGIKVGN